MKPRVYQTTGFHRTDSIQCRIVVLFAMCMSLEQTMQCSMSRPCPRESVQQDLQKKVPQRNHQISFFFQERVSAS